MEQAFSNFVGMVQVDLSAIAGNVVLLVLSPVSHFSIWSLLCAFCMAFGFLIARRRGKPLPLKLAIRALFPRRLLTGPSARADWGFLLLNGVLGPLLFGWALVSFQVIGGWTSAGLTQAFGANAATGLPQLAIGAVMSVALFIAYETGYWLDHYLSHHVPLLWHFHKVHHTAETLSPMTNFRVHPVDTIKFYNIVALTTGLASGILTWALGAGAEPLTIGSVNVLMVAFVFLLLHLQHSQLWIAFPGKLGKVILSPAHHQLHHSSDPRHFNRNFGNSIALFDWMFGTLRVPSAARERLTYGVAGLGHNPHNAHGGLVRPFVDAAARAFDVAASPQLTLDTEA